MSCVSTGETTMCNLFQGQRRIIVPLNLTFQVSSPSPVFFIHAGCERSAAAGRTALTTSMLLYTHEAPQALRSQAKEEAE